MNSFNIYHITDVELKALLRKGPAPYLISEDRAEAMINLYVRKQWIDHIHVMASMTEEYNLDWNQININDQTPLGMCVEENLLKSAKALLNIDFVRVNQCGYGEFDSRVNSPALLAMEIERKEMFSLLVNHPRTELHARYDNDGEHYTLLSKSLEQEDTHYLSELCKRKDLDVMQENDEVTPIYSLVESEKLEHLKIIVQHPRINFERQYPEESPLIGAIRKGNPKIVEILLKSGADPEEIDGTSTAEPLDAYHHNIFFCCKINTNEDAENRRDIANILLDMGITPKEDRHGLQALEDVITAVPNNAPPIIVQFRADIGNYLYDKLRHEIRKMDYLARGHILKNLRTTARGKSIRPLLKALEKEERLPEPCLRFLNFE